MKTLFLILEMVGFIAITNAQYSCPQGEHPVCLAYETQCHDEEHCIQWDLHGNCSQKILQRICNNVCRSWGCAKNANELTKVTDREASPEYMSNKSQEQKKIVLNELPTRGWTTLDSAVIDYKLSYLIKLPIEKSISVEVSKADIRTLDSKYQIRNGSKGILKEKISESDLKQLRKADGCWYYCPPLGACWSESCNNCCD